jgi:hypothetical protein
MPGATREAAEEHIELVYSWPRRCRLEPIKKVFATPKRHLEWILAYCRNETTSAVMWGATAVSSWR